MSVQYIYERSSLDFLAHVERCLSHCVAARTESAYVDVGANRCMEIVLRKRAKRRSTIRSGLVTAGQTVSQARIPRHRHPREDPGRHA